MEASYSPMTTLTKKTFNALHEQISLTNARPKCGIDLNCDKFKARFFHKEQRKWYL